MAKVYYYSKRYSQQGAPIKPVSYTDLFLFSRAVPVVLPYKLGFRTHSASLDDLKTYTVTEFKKLGSVFHFDNGLAGTGSLADPVHLDDVWLDQVYINARDWPFSQVGDPTDSTLPIGGTYFSVSYPFINNHYSPVVPFVEGNGDMRILRTVTNGEDITPVYSVWKNYKNTSISTMVHTDIVYRPPGLSADEYIHHVYSATDSAMLVEIWSRTLGFREYAFVLLNGTMVANYHQLIRLGHQPLTVMVGVTNPTEQEVWRAWFRACNVNAIVVKGRLYIGMLCPHGAQYGTTLAGDTSVNRFIFAEVFLNGTMSLMTNWTCTNSEGSTIVHSKMAILNRTLATAIESDKDGVFLNLSPDSINFGYQLTPNRSYWGGVNSKGYVSVINYHNYTISTARKVRECRPAFYYDIDFDNHRVIPSDGASNRRWTFTMDVEARYVRTTTSKSYFDDDTLYEPRGIMVGILNNGDRYAQTIPGDSGVKQNFYLMRGLVTSIDTATNDANFVNDNLNTLRDMQIAPPTPVVSNCKATLLYDKLRVVNYSGEYQVADYNTPISLSLLSGNVGDQTYRLLDTNISAPPTSWQGYRLNNNRVNGPTPQPPGIVAIRKNNALYYHNAVWTNDTVVTTSFSYAINSNSVGQYTFKIHQNVYDKMNTFMRSIPIDSGYTEISSQKWTLLPIYPGIGENYAFVRFLSSSKAPDSSSVDGWALSGLGQIFAMAPITYVIDSSGVATITDIDLTTVSPNLDAYKNSMNTLNTNVWHETGSAAIDIDVNGYGLLYRGGPTGSFYENNDSYSFWPQALKFNTARQRTTWIHNCADVRYNLLPTVSLTHGLGFIDNVGLGAFYAFRPYSFTTNKLGSAAESYVVGSARPAAGFNLTINAPIPVYVEGRLYLIPKQTIDLSALPLSYKNAHFYCYAILRDGLAQFYVTLDQLEEHLDRIYVGYIKTSTTEITEINCTPVTRWEVARPSTSPIGGALPTSTGFPHETDVRVWENVQLVPGLAHEYMWGGDDIIDSVVS